MNNFLLLLSYKAPFSFWYTRSKIANPCFISSIDFFDAFFSTLPVGGINLS